jgi:alpha-beta hydrolase superfamily lysophospholipase
MLASDDPVTNNAETREFIARIGSQDRTIIEYPDASHTLEFEDDPSKYFSDLADWCTRVAQSALRGS